MIEQLKDGLTLITENDLYSYFEKSFNKRNNYDKSCSFCKHENDARCSDCSLESDNTGCSCHIAPPCSNCVDLMFEPTKHLINYKHYRQNQEGKWKWECFKSDQKTWKTFNKMESDGWELSTETLSTGVIAIYLEKRLDEIEEIELCGKKAEFKNTVIKFINETNRKKLSAETQ